MNIKTQKQVERKSNEIRTYTSKVKPVLSGHPYITTSKYHATMTLISLFSTLPVDFQLKSQMNSIFRDCFCPRHLCFA